MKDQLVEGVLRGEIPAALFSSPLGETLNEDRTRQRLPEGVGLPIFVSYDDDAASTLPGISLRSSRKASVGASS
jgi:hypothetical protein